MTSVPPAVLSNFYSFVSFLIHKNLFNVHKKLSVIVTAVAIFTFIFVLSPVFLNGGARAIETGLEATRSAAQLPSETNIATIVGQIIYAILGFLGVVFVILLIYGGFLRMTAQGDSGKIKTSNGIITSAVVGVVIILAAYTLTAFILSQVGASVGGGEAGGVGENLDSNYNDDATPLPPNPTTCDIGICRPIMHCLPDEISIGQKDCAAEQACCVKTSSYYR